MARYRRSYRRSRRPVNQSWTNFTFNNLSITPTSDGENHLLAKQLLVNLGDQDGTLERMRGSLQVSISATKSYWAVGFGLILPSYVLDGISAGAKATVLPDPTDNESTDDFFWVQNLCIPAAAGSFELEVDSKAKRRIEKDEMLVLGCHFVDGSSGTGAAVTFTGLIRALCSCRS